MELGPSGKYEFLERGGTVLTATRRLAHALRTGYATYAQAQKRTVWFTPKAIPWSAWLRERWLQERVRSAGEANALRLLSPTQAQLLWKEVVTASEVGQTLLDPASAARSAARSWERLQQFEIPLTELATHDTLESTALLQWAEAFQERCVELDAIDEAQLPAWAIRAGFAPEGDIALLGFDQVTPIMQRLFDAWQARGCRCIELADGEPASAQGKVAAADVEAELELAARWARVEVEAGKQSIAIVSAELSTRRAAIQRVFEDVFVPGLRSLGTANEYVPFAIAAAEPLASYSPVAVALTCIELARGGVTSTVVSYLLRSPFIAGCDSERDARALADLELRRSRQPHWSWRELERWADAHYCPALAALGRAINPLLAECGAPATPSRWAEHFYTWLRAAGWPGERALSSDEYQTVIKFQSVLADLGSLDALLGPLTLAQAFTQLRQLAHDIVFEPETPPTPVLIIDPLTAAGQRFESLWVLGMEASQFPRAPSPDPLLPLELQRRAGMLEATAAGALVLAQRQLERLAHSAATVIVSWPERADDEELQPSPLIVSWPDVPGIGELAGPRTFRQTLFEARPSLGTCKDVQAPAVSQEAARGGARILELQSRCAFRAQAELRLGAALAPVAGLGVDPADRGTLVHRVLASFWSEIRDQERLLTLDAATTEQKLRELAHLHAAQMLPSQNERQGRLITLEVNSTVARITALLDIERTRTPFRVRHIERGGTFNISGMTIKLQPDRIDDLASGGHLLIDYKTGAANFPQQWHDRLPGRPPRPQLPLYALAYLDGLAAIAYAVLAPGKVEYRGWGKRSGIVTGVRAYPEELKKQAVFDTWEALLEHWRMTLAGLAAQFMEGRAEINPLPYECAQCHLPMLCRVHEQGAPADDSDVDLGESGDE
jgi:probable DNA repair protein